VICLLFGQNPMLGTLFTARSIFVLTAACSFSRCRSSPSDRSRFLGSVFVAAGQSDFSAHMIKRRLSHSSSSFILRQALHRPMFLTLPLTPCVSVLPPEPCWPDFDSHGRHPDFIPAGLLLCRCCSHPSIILHSIFRCRRPRAVLP
jgi:hypothetical protein